MFGLTVIGDVLTPFAGIEDMLGVLAGIGDMLGLNERSETRYP